VVLSLSHLPLFLGGHAKGSNKDAAQNMAGALKGGGAGNTSPLKDALALGGNSGVAGFISAKSRRLAVGAMSAARFWKTKSPGATKSSPA